ncbi:hypothetical protein [Peribacillus sp. R9-11]|nr:hypothetical protein [Peribacillus sp. R9-11]WMX58525.1 hypothetical protein RE409_28850 [Peribacillus sp. R9-11]
MLESNVFRLIMFIGAVIVVGIIISSIIENIDEINTLYDNFFSYRLKKY